MKRSSMEKRMDSFDEIVKTEHNDGWSVSTQYDGYGNVVESCRPDPSIRVLFDQ